MTDMEIIMGKFIKNFILVVTGFMFGVIEENLRYSIIYHEAKKGNAESQAIIDQFDVVGQQIEDYLS